jgi:type II secretion system protein G
MKKMQNSSGFTLVELIVVIVIISVLITIGIASYATIQKRARDTRRKSDIEQIRSALEMYRADTKYYPSVGAGSYIKVNDTAGLKSVLVSNYISAVPDDPNSSNNYYYKAVNLVSGQYYGYCLSAILEIDNGTDQCTPNTSPSQNYGTRNP